jgi:hypothetical protein
MNLRRGFVRMAIGAAAMWFVFWTSAYVMVPYTSLAPVPTFDTRITAPSVIVPCVVAAVILAGWIAAGFRSG